MHSLRALCALLTMLAVTVVHADPVALVTGVTQISAPGTPGPVHAMTAEWSAIAAGDDDATFPSVVVLARDYGAGRVTAVGHESLIHSVDVLDNDVFMQNMITWLDVAGTKDILYSTGHGEWIQGQLNALAALMAPDGYSFSPVSGTLTGTNLAAGSVLIVGNAWGEFTGAEIEAVRQFVDNGGGLCLAGLGWSWEPNNPG